MRFPGTPLARHRVRAGLTQAELGRMVGVSAGSISCVENRHAVAWPRLRRACSEVLGVAEEVLFPEADRRRVPAVDEEPLDAA